MVLWINVVFFLVSSVFLNLVNIGCGKNYSIFEVKFFVLLDWFCIMGSGVKGCVNLSKENDVCFMEKLVFLVIEKMY